MAIAFCEVKGKVAIALGYDRPLLKLIIEYHSLVSKRDQLLELLKNSPNNGKFSGICKLLELEGFSLDRITGSHHIFKRNDVILVIPVHNKK